MKKPEPEYGWIIRVDPPDSPAFEMTYRSREEANQERAKFIEQGCDVTKPKRVRVEPGTTWS